MKILQEMTGVAAVGTSTGYAFLCRGGDGRLCIVGDCVDLFSLLRWIDENPLAQFRELPPDPDEGKPHHLFAHLFNAEGKLDDRPDTQA